MNIIYKESLGVEDYNALREVVGWHMLCKEQAQSGLEHSAYIISAYNDNQIVGAARIIWDRGYIAYLADVMVMPEYQGKGIGCRLVERAIDFVKSQLKEGWKIKIVLVSAKGREAFYEKFGFVERPNENAGAGMDLWITS